MTRTTPSQQPSTTNPAKTDFCSTFVALAEAVHEWITPRAVVKPGWRKECERRDLNPHVFRHWILSRLPPNSKHIAFTLLTRRKVFPRCELKLRHVGVALYERGQWIGNIVPSLSPSLQLWAWFVTCVQFLRTESLLLPECARHT